jgi:hypothetical protein
MKWKLLMLAVGVAFFAILFFPLQFYWLFWPHTLQDVIQQVFNSRENDYVIAYPQEVTAQVLHQNTGDGTTLDEYSKDAPVTLSLVQIRQLRALLQDPKSYHWGMGKTCNPDYGVLYHFRAQGHTIRVAVCFKCDVLGVFDGDDDHATRINNQSLFTPMHAQLIAFTKTLFPDDKTIQALQ